MHGLRASKEIATSRDRWASRAAGRRSYRAQQERDRVPSDVDRGDSWMQSGEEVGKYAKSQPLFAKFTKLQTSIAKLFEGYVGV